MNTEMIPFTAETVAVQRPAFWSIADDLEAYQETLLMLEAQIGYPGSEMTDAENEERDLAIDERSEVLAHIERLTEALVKKTDDLAGVLRRMKSDISEQKAEEKRIHARRKASEAALSHLEGYTSGVMSRHGWRHLKTAKNTVALRGNGGLQPLQIAPELVPDPLCTWRGEISNFTFQAVLSLVDRYFNCSGSGAPAIRSAFIRIPSNSLIRDALSQPCATCDGTTRIHVPLSEIPGSALNNGCTEMTELCPACAGTGSASVPGCSLAPRGERLEVR